MRERVGWWVLGMSVVAFVVVLVMVLTGTGLALADHTVLDWFVEGRTPGATTWWTALTEVFGAVLLPLIVAAGCALWWWRGRPRDGVPRWWRPALLAGAMVVEVVVSLVLKAVIARPRPPDVSQVVPGAMITHSFPSGHVMGAVTLTLTVAMLVGTASRRTAGWWVLALLVASLVSAGVAVSRLYLGYHFVTDVVGGAFAASAVVGLVLVVDGRYGARYRRTSVVDPASA